MTIRYYKRKNKKIICVIFSYETGLEYFGIGYNKFDAYEEAISQVFDETENDLRI